MSQSNPSLTRPKIFWIGLKLFLYSIEKSNLTPFFFIGLQAGLR